jgi:hypothetical protein
MGFIHLVLTIDLIHESVFFLLDSNNTLKWTMLQEDFAYEDPDGT